MISCFIRTMLCIVFLTFCQPGHVSGHDPHICLAEDTCAERRLTKLENGLEKRVTKLENEVSRIESLLQEKNEDCNHFQGDSCERLYYKGERKDGHYILDLGVEGHLRVFCKFSHKPVQTIIEHNYPQKTDTTGAAECDVNIGEKIYNITYGKATKEQLVKMMQGKRCSQFLKYDCHASLITHKAIMQAYWADRDGNRMSYWAGGPANGGCACSLDNSCAGSPTQLCNCEKNDFVWRYDEGYITDTSRLPVSALRFCDANEPGEKGHFTLGPLVCVKK